MSSARRTTRELLTQALEHLQAASDYTRRDLSDPVVIDAISMRLSAGLETLGIIDLTERSRLFGPLWPQMRGMRNRIAHNYGLIDSEVIKRTAEHDIPQILAIIRSALDGDQVD